jgi:phage/plasmid primase-like uncharacterized protein
MHLHHPSLSMAGKKKGKQKFRNAAEARKARELAAEWEELQKKWAPKPTIKKVFKQESLSPAMGTARAVPQNIPSKVTTGGDCTKKEVIQYTGTKMLGIGTMHKSNSVPVFSDDEAIAISTMRR